MNERFSTYLHFKRLSQKRLSELSSVGQAVISRFCNGNAITSDKLLRLLQVCDDLSLEWLFYGSGEMIRSCPSQTTINMGAFAGADVVGDGGVQVKNANGVNVSQGPDKRYLDIISDKDKIISEKDRIIMEKDAVIQQLLKRLV